MNFSIAAMLLIGGLSQVHSHGTEVRRCLTLDGNLRIFVEHWHTGKFGDVITTSNSGTMTIQQNHLPGSPSITLLPTGVVTDTLPGSLPGCISNDVLVTTCDEVWNDWVWYDFPTSCDNPVDYTLISGNTQVLEDCFNNNGGGPLYPANIQTIFTDTSAPAIKIDGSICQGHIVIADADTCAASGETGSGVATWGSSAQDDCDPNPTFFSSSHVSGTSFPVGDTAVTIQYKDNKDRLASCTFTVSMKCGQNSAVASKEPSSGPSFSPSIKPSPTPSKSPSKDPSSGPSTTPSNKPSNIPTNEPSTVPSDAPTKRTKTTKNKKSGKGEGNGKGKGEGNGKGKGSNKKYTKGKGKGD